MRRLFLDLDGVLADFDTQYEHVFGARNDHDAPEPPDFWQRLGAHAEGHFYRDLPMMADAQALWDGVASLGLRPTILTGIPHSLPHAESDKRAWVARHFGLDVPVICCASKDKRTHGQPGDILVDDWRKYRSLWEDMGGVFVLHTSATASLGALSALMSEAPAHV